MVKKCVFSVAVILLLSSVGSASIGYPYTHIGFGPHLGFGYGYISPMTNCFAGTLIRHQMVGHYFGAGALLPCHQFVWRSPCHVCPMTNCGANLVKQYQCQIINSCGGSVIAKQKQVCIIGP